MTDSRQQNMQGVDIRNLEPGLAQVIIQPTAKVEPLGDTTSVNLHVQDGAIRVWISEGSGEARVKMGPAILSDDGSVFCDRENRGLSPESRVVLSAGNSCFVENGILHLEVVGDKAAELHMGATQKSAGRQAAGKDQRTRERRADARTGSGEETERGKKDKKDKDGSSGDGGITTYACWVCPGTRP